MISKRSPVKRKVPIIALTALFLTAATMLTLPLTASRYLAAGTVASSTKVAKFDPIWGLVIGYNSGAGFVNPGTKTIAWELENKSEVRVEAELHMLAIDTSFKIDAKRPAEPNYPVGRYRAVGSDSLFKDGRVRVHLVSGLGTFSVTSPNPAKSEVGPSGTQVFTGTFTGGSYLPTILPMALVQLPTQHPAAPLAGALTA